MLPYFEQPTLHLGPIPIHAFGIAVAIAIWVGLDISQRRFRQSGLDPIVGQQFAGWVLGGGIIGAHLFSVLLYFPDRLAADPWLLVRLWDNVSSFGGMLGAIAGGLAFFAVRAAPEIRPLRWAYLDVAAFILPPTLAIGRFGCTLAHDHPGSVTTFPLSISLKTDAALQFIRAVYGEAGRSLPQPAPGQPAWMGFHDLGWYEFLFLSAVVVPLFYLWSKRERPQGFYLLAFPALYLPVRFGMDFLRIADATYAGLTPAQWVALAVMAMLPFFAMKVFQRPLPHSAHAPTP